MTEVVLPELAALGPLLAALVPLNRTIVSDDMDRAFELVDAGAPVPPRRYRYPSGAEYGSWIVPPSWNVREAYVSDGSRILGSYLHHPLFLAPYSAPFDGWIEREELFRHLFLFGDRDDTYAYQHRIAYDYHRRLAEWQISLPRRVVAAMEADRYYVKIDVEVRPGRLNVAEYVVPGTEERSLALVAHLCHPGQANDGLSGVIAGLAFLRRVSARPHRFTYRLIVLPETIGSAVHVIDGGLSPSQCEAAVFLETMGGGEQLCVKLSRRGEAMIDRAAESVARDQGLRVIGFDDGYGNDEHVLDFPNVGIPTIGIQHFPVSGYHTSADSSDQIDWFGLSRAVLALEAITERLELARPVTLRYPGPPYLSRYRLYADFAGERDRFRRVSAMLSLCDGQHTIGDIADLTATPHEDVTAFFDVLRREGLLL